VEAGQLSHSQGDIKTGNQGAAKKSATPKKPVAKEVKQCNKRPVK
jgi:hypothetical protein